MNRTALYQLSPDDPRLTAFALGELEGEELSHVAAAVAARPELQSVVDEVRRAADELTAALATEPLPEVTPVPFPTSVNGHHATVLAFPSPISTTRAQATPATPAPPARRRKQSPQLSYFWAMSVAAACFMLVVFIAERRSSQREEAETRRLAERAATERARLAAAATGHYVEVNVAILASAAAEAVRDQLMGDAAAAPEPDDATYLPTEQQPKSSFPIDVATTSYGDVVRAIALKQRPQIADVRIEEMLNTFAYDYPGPAANDVAPFAASLEAADAPWAPDHRLVRIGLKGRDDSGGRSTAIARNVSIVVEFDPASVQAYRLIGYEKSPIVAQESLSTGRVNAAEILSGHTVTALYEVIPRLDHAGEPVAVAPVSHGTRLLTVRIAYTTPEGSAARPLEFPLIDRGASFGDASGDFKFAAAVAGFGMILRQPGPSGPLNFGSIIAWAEQGVSHDTTGHRREFVSLVRDASQFVR